MSSRLSAKLLCLMLVGSLLFLGYASMSSWAITTPIPGKVTISSAVEIKQGANVSYYFAHDASLNRLEISETYIWINGQFRLGTQVSVGHINVTLISFASSNQVSWSADPGTANPRVTWTISGLSPAQKYSITRDQTIVAYVLANSQGTATYVYTGIWTAHLFTLNVYNEGSQATNVNADFTYKANGLKVSFQDNSQGHGIYKWLWDFGDGMTSTKQDPSHTYAKSGSYRVTLTVMSADGISDTITKTIKVSGVASGPQLLSLATMLAFGLMFGGAVIIVALRRPAAIIVGVLAFLFGILLIFFGL